MPIECALFGAVAREPELKTAKNGRQYLRVSLRVDNGDAAVWPSVLYFGDDADAAELQLERGERVYVEGSLKVDVWKRPDGTAAPNITIVANILRPPQIGKRRPKRERQADARPPLQASGPEDELNDPLPW
jgi:single-stranded DNA-binding protein